ncbi:ankyrin repeat family A protein 2 [Galendromus occidentalis]|uniref:Ankyrin repeat family A protein 2 n=1 Tax=Galendromus occidentalis TaxID=34638 RepID=A0AAJ6VW30_9ACAR|nr:ankyrin repeat family A protein 2 [Galendromus occidentalis]
MASSAMTAHICPEVYNLQGLNGVQSTNGVFNGANDKAAITTFLKPVTVLTNLQRGNVPTQTPMNLILRCIHQLVAQGDIPKEPFAESRIELCDSEGLTPLMWAAFHGQLLSVRKLLLQRVNVNAQGFQGQSALLFAACRGHTCVVKELVAHGADINHADCDGCTALMYAASGDHAETCKELLLAGASVFDLNEFMDTAYDLAAAGPSEHVLEVFENHLFNLFD